MSRMYVYKPQQCLRLFDTYLEYFEYFNQMRLFCKMENLVDVI